MKKKMKNVATFLSMIILGLFLSLIIFCNDEEVEPVPEKPIIEGVAKIEITNPTDSEFGDTLANDFLFMYVIPDGVKNVMIVFIEGVFNVSGTEILHDTFIGNRTGISGLEGMTLNTVNASDLYYYNGSEFVDNPSSGTINYTWAVIGYDSSGLIVAASPERMNSINWGL